MHQPILLLTHTTPAHDVDPSTTPTTSANDHIHNFSDLEWDSENEPDPSQNKLYHLLTITGLLIVANYPADHTLGEHYLAWAHLTSEPTLTLH